MNFTGNSVGIVYLWHLHLLQMHQMWSRQKLLKPCIITQKCAKGYFVIDIIFIIISLQLLNFISSVLFCWLLNYLVRVIAYCWFLLFISASIELICANKMLEIGPYEILMYMFIVLFITANVNTVLGIFKRGSQENGVE